MRVSERPGQLQTVQEVGHQMKLLLSCLPCVAFLSSMTSLNSHANMPMQSAEGALEYLRHSFALQRHKTDYYDIKYALSDGREQLKKWREMLGMAG